MCYLRTSPRKNWCAIIDTRRLLRASTASSSSRRRSASILVKHMRPSSGRRISGHLNNLQADDYDRWILDHCNGVLLLWELLFNPATRQSVHLPPFPELSCSFYESYFLAYDPLAPSPQHYELLLFPRYAAANEEGSSAPCSPFVMHVFSSKKWRWEERSFVREGHSSASYYGPEQEEEPQLRHAVYLQGALYVHCQNDSVMRITLWNNKYQMIESPTENQVGVTYLGKSQKGVYYASLSAENRRPRFRLWVLNESCSKMDWSLKNDIGLTTMVENFPIDYTKRYDTPWILNYRKDVGKAWTEDDPESDFESGIILDETRDKITTCYKGLFFLGFHPYKEIAFFLVSFSRVVSYHLNTSKFQELGILNKAIIKSFPYTPCWMGELYDNN